MARQLRALLPPKKRAKTASSRFAIGGLAGPVASLFGPAILRRRGAAVDWLIVGLGNPGSRYARTRHNVGYMVGERLVDRYDLGKSRSKYRGRLSQGRLGPGGQKVAVLIPETFMNESGKSVGPARGDLRVDPGRIIVVHDEIDFPFGRVEPRLGGGAAGHNGLKSIKAGLGTSDFQRIRVGVGRPDSTDPEIVSAWVLGPFNEPTDEVDTLVDDALAETVRLIEQSD